MIRFDDDTQNERIATLRAKEEEDAIKRTSQKMGIPYVDLSGMVIETDALGLIPEAEARSLDLAGFKLVGKDVYVAIGSPDKPGVRERLEDLQQKGYKVGLYVTSRASLEKAWSRYSDLKMTSATRASLVEISGSELEEITARVKGNEGISEMVQEMLQDKSPKMVTSLIATMLGGAIATDSSDVHIEPQEETVQLRLRQDGVLHNVTTFDHKVYSKLNSRVKILSHLKLTQDAQAQDGRFTIEYQGQAIEVRTSIIPGAYGESIVLRILNPDMISVSMDKLGIEPKLFAILKNQIHKPNGLIVTTGPTGSGKTTTLYSFLKEVYNPGIKILTIEDPIEYHLNGITQTQAEKEKGYTFASGLRGALRQDPDVIMVGEIRDSETAEIAVNASLTGHIVFSTLHTNNAAGAIPRLLDLKINPKVLPSSLSVAIAQRLVRKLVPECKEAYKPDEKTERLIRDILKKAEANGKDLAAYGVSADQEIVLYRPKGDCSVGNGTGYKGRIGVFEAILMDEAMEKIITKNPSEREIRHVADRQGILSMQEDGVLKALAGVTSLEEVQKIVDLEEYLYDEKLPTDKNYDKGASLQSVKPVPEIELPKQAAVKSHQADQVLDKEMSGDDLSHALQRKMPSSETLSDHIRDAEIILLLEKLKQLEIQQEEDPTESVESHIRKIRGLIIEVIKNNPPTPRLSIDQDGNVVKNEIGLLLNELLDIEKDQAKNPTKSAAGQIKKTRKKLEGHVEANT